MPADAAALVLQRDTDIAAPSFALDVRSSFSGRPWHFRATKEATLRALEQRGFPAALARFLAARGIFDADADRFLEPRLKDLLSDPYVFAGMEAAAERVAQAIRAGETVGVLGDYDVDGACSAALLLRFLRAAGVAAELYVPDRLTEGYGPSAHALAVLKERGAQLVLTVDCGAAATRALAAGRAIGLDVIVLDHHAVDADPPAFAHVNANGPSDRSGLTHVCAAGVVFFLLVAVQRLLRRDGAPGCHFDLIACLDLVALATVADVVPLLGVNRAFVRQGLKVLERRERPGLAALLRVASAASPLSTQTLGFVLGPRINAGGRVGRCDLGAQLLASDDPAQCERLALELDLHNRERQSVEATILAAAEARAAVEPGDAIVCCAGDGWHPGVVGVVASRLKDRFGKPALVAGFADAAPETVGRGSGRSVRGVDLGAHIRAALAAGLLESGGGHAMAVGFSLRRQNWEAFRAFLVARLATETSTIAASRDLVIDSVASPAAADVAFLALLEQAGPFGAGHPDPLFVLPDMGVAFAATAGVGHVRLRLLARDGAGVDAIAFRAAGTPLGQALLRARGSRIHVVGRLKRDDYGGNLRVQLQVEDAAPVFA